MSRIVFFTIEAHFETRIEFSLSKYELQAQLQ